MANERLRAFLWRGCGPRACTAPVHRQRRRCSSIVVGIYADADEGCSPPPGASAPRHTSGSVCIRSAARRCASGRGGEVSDVLEVGALITPISTGTLPGAHAGAGLPDEAAVRRAVRSARRAGAVDRRAQRARAAVHLAARPRRGRPKLRRAELQDRLTARLAEAGVSNDRTDLALVVLQTCAGSMNVKTSPLPVVIEDARELGRRFTPEWLGQAAAERRRRRAPALLGRYATAPTV